MESVVRFFTLNIFGQLILLNAYSFFRYADDKLRAKSGRWRISEPRLLAASLLGPFGALAGIYRLHHKSQKGLFTVLVPVFAVIQVVFVIWKVFFGGGPEWDMSLNELIRGFRI